MNHGFREHMLKLFDSKIRLDGRSLEDYRNVSLRYGIVQSAEGSAQVKIGETEVIVGVKLEVGEPYPDSLDEGTLMVGAELLPLSNPDFELGPPGIQAIELARVVDRGIRESKAIDFKKLCIKEGEKAWIVVIDICTINDAGNLFDASALAAIAALRDTVFPKFDGERIDYREKTKQKLPLDKEPISVTVCKIGKSLFVDPLSEEEAAVEARLTVASKKDGTLCALQKGGDAPLTSEEVLQMIELGLEKAKELREVL